MFRGKKYQESAKQIDKAMLYDPKEGLELICKTASAKFDETVELHVKLGVDSRHADQQVRGAIVLPNGTGKSVRVLVFAKGDKAEAAKAAGADFVKTSTGFSTDGATTHDIALMRKTVGPEMGVKASGGIRDYATAMAMIEAGANRIGASAGIEIVAAAE